MKKKTITYKIKCNHTIGKIHPIDEKGMYCEFENRYLTEKEITKLLKKLKTVNLLSEARNTMNKIKKLPKTNFYFNSKTHDTYFEVDGIKVYNLGIIDKINELIDAVNLLNNKYE